MQDIIGSVRRSLVFRTTPENNEGTGFGVGIGTLVDKINYGIRMSRVFTKPLPAPSSRPIIMEAVPTIRWRKGEMIGCGAFGQVYMGMNLDSGELLAVKQVLIAANGASKEKAQAHIKELEEEVKLLKDLSHPNIVRYLGTAREENTLNILLEFVPGGSISSLLGKFGAFPEAVVRTYTKQLLLGLEYLHNNGIMHRDIKGANILVDNKGCIKLADFGASKQVVELATISGAKSMKGTPYWMAPEVILQTGHSFSADIWSVGCTVIEMATGKPPWSQQYQEVAALFHIGTTKSPPPIPEHLSFGAKDFLVKCLQKTWDIIHIRLADGRSDRENLRVEPSERPIASELLQHPFVTGEHTGPTSISRNSALVGTIEARSGSQSLFGTIAETSKIWSASDSMDVSNMGSLHRSTVCQDRLSGNQQYREMNGDDDDMCQLDDQDDFKMVEVKPISPLISDNFLCFNQMCEPSDNWGCSSSDRLQPAQQVINTSVGQVFTRDSTSGVVDDDQKKFSFPYAPSLCEDDDEVTESKIQAFLDEKALELKKMQTPLYEEFYNTMIGSCSPDLLDISSDEATMKYLKLPPKCQSPSRVPAGTSSKAVDSGNGSPASISRLQSTIGNPYDHSRQECSSSPTNDSKVLVADYKCEQSSPSVSFAERQRKWKEELDRELQKQREMMRQAGTGGKTSSPNHHKQRERTRFASPGK